MAQMKDDELVSLVSTASSDAVQFSGEFNSESELALQYYLGLPFGDEEEGRSALISTDVQDVIEADMPSLVRTFLGSNNVMKFEPLTVNKEDAEEAEQKTKYINWLIRKQPDSFAILHGWMKNALIQKISVVKYFIEDTLTTTEETHENLSDFEVAAIQEDLNIEGVEKVEIVESEVLGNEKFNVTFRITKGKQELSMSNVAPEDFRVSRFSTDLDSAELVGDDEIITRGELLSQGYDRKLIDRLNRVNNQGIERTNDQSNLKDIRFHDEDGATDGTEGNEITDWASEEVSVENRYIKIDFDGDGIAERRFVRISGLELLDNEPFDHTPYAALSAILMPNKLIGRSRAELVMETQRAKSVMLRGAADNTYAVNNPRIGVNENVNIDDLLTVTLNGVVRNEGIENPGNNMFPIEVPFIADKALLMLNYLDQQRANRTGALVTSQSLNADDLNQETATRFNGVEATGKEKTELISRVFSETGWKKLYEGVAWMVSRFQNTELEIMITGEELKVKPKNWKFEQHAISEVGLAISDNEDSITSLAAILTDQLQLQAMGSELVDNVKIFNTRERLTKATGIGNVADFYNNPEVPDETLKAENELLRQQVEQLSAQVQTNPLAEAQAVEAQQKREKAQADAQIDVAKLGENQRQFDINAIQKQGQIDDKHDVDVKRIALDMTELEQKENKDLSEQARQNEQDSLV